MQNWESSSKLITQLGNRPMDCSIEISYRRNGTRRRYYVWFSRICVDDMIHDDRHSSSSTLSPFSITLRG